MGQLYTPDESDIIEIFRAHTQRRRAEDVELFKLGKERTAINIDSMTQSSDVPPGFAPRLITRKSVIACASDFASKGIRPEFGIISITIPKGYARKKITELAAGIATASKEIGVRMIGGDTGFGAELAISVCLVGCATHIVKRDAAKIGDAVFVSGPFGYAAAGLEIALNKKKVGRAFKKKAGRAFKKKALDALYRPESRITFGAAVSKLMSASMDSSDGLALTLHEISRQSKKRIIISNIPAGKGVAEFSKENKIDPKKLVLYGGEEYELVFTAARKNTKKILALAAKHRVRVIEIGSIRRGGGVVLEDGNTIRDAGWQRAARS